VEIHKPKSWHGPGEFFREYLIIVAGVLTALGGEQAVEWMHHQNELAETREALREEIAQNAKLITLGVALDSCRAVIVEKLADWARGGPKPKKSTPPSFVSLNFGVWDVAKSGPLSRMPVKERLSYALVYDAFEKAQKSIDRQADFAIGTVQYRYQEQLNSDQAQRLLELSSALRVLLEVGMGGKTALLNQIQTLGISPKPVSDGERETLNGLCEVAGVPAPTL
jgi:hypothetical protein